MCIDVVLVFSLLICEYISQLFPVFRCWLWARKCWLSSDLKQNHFQYILTCFCPSWLGKDKSARILLVDGTDLFINPLQPAVAFLYLPRKPQRTFRFSDVFRGYGKATPGCNGLNMQCSIHSCCHEKWRLLSENLLFLVLSELLSLPNKWQLQRENRFHQY